MEKQKIRFINSSYKTLFYVDDGDEIEVEINGVWKRYKVQYLDDFHIKTANMVFHICEFAQRLEKAGQRYRPANSETPLADVGIRRQTDENVNEAVKQRPSGNGGLK